MKVVGADATVVSAWLTRETDAGRLDPQPTPADLIAVAQIIAPAERKDRQRYQLPAVEVGRPDHGHPHQEAV